MLVNPSEGAVNLEGGAKLSIVQVLLKENFEYICNYKSGSGAY